MTIAELAARCRLTPAEFLQQKAIERVGPYDLDPHGTGPLVAVVVGPGHHPDQAQALAELDAFCKQALVEWYACAVLGPFPGDLRIIVAQPPSGYVPPVWARGPLL